MAAAHAHAIVHHDHKDFYFTSQIDAGDIWIMNVWLPADDGG